MSALSQERELNREIENLFIEARPLLQCAGTIISEVI